MGRSLVFIFIGDKLPRYAKASLEIAGRWSGLQPQLLAPRKLLAKMKNSDVSLVALEDFYSNEGFHDAANRLLYPSDFRNKFWVKTLERLFVLEQYLAETQDPHIFHAELDQLLFRADLLVGKLLETKRTGIFLPFHSPNLAVASVMFCNELAALRKLIDFARSGAFFESEMHLMARFANLNPAMVHALPTVATEIRGAERVVPTGVSTLCIEEAGGIVDAAQLGQWIGGVDPRNIPVKDWPPQLKYVEPPKEFLLRDADLRSLRFQLEPNNELLIRTSESQEARLYNLHLHSKIHDYLKDEKRGVRRLIDSANKSDTEYSFQVLIFLALLKSKDLSQRAGKFLTRLAYKPSAIFQVFSRSINCLVKRRPSSYPLISGDTFREKADHVIEKGRQAFNAKEVRPNDVVFCESDLLEVFLEEARRSLTVSCWLILGNSDRNLGRELEEINSLGLNVSVYCQNLVQQIPNCYPLPIGLENAWLARNGVPRHYLRRSAEGSRRLSRIMSRFTISANPLERVEAEWHLRETSLTDFLRPMSARKHRSALRRYMFVACPPSNGIDTHRVWEAMYLGCVPIVKRSHMTSYFESLGLPLWPVKRYSELNGLSEADLSVIYKKFERQFNSEALFANFWFEKFEATQRMS